MEVSTKYTKGDGTITVESTYRLKRATVPEQGFLDVKKLREELEQKNGLYIILKRSSNLGQDAQDWIKGQ